MVNMRYKNNNNVSIEMRGENIVSSYFVFKNYTLNYENSELTETSRSVSIPVVCNSVKAANELISTLEYDSNKGTAGRLYIGDWYTKALYTGFSIVTESGSRVKLNVSFYLPKPMFTKETDFAIQNEGTAQASDGVGFPYDFPYDYLGDNNSQSKITNSEQLPADMVLRFSADAENVAIYIGENSYIVNSRVKSDETFVLDTFEKEVYKLKNGEKISLFGFSDDDNYIFSQIPSGTQEVAWDGDYTIYVTLCEHRRTPPWT